MLGIYEDQGKAVNRAVHYVCHYYKRRPDKRVLVAEVSIYGKYMYAVGLESHVSRILGYCLVRKVAHVRSKK